MAGKRKNGTGAVRKRANGSWEARFIVNYTLEGKPIFKSVTAASKSECIKKMQETKEALGVTHEKVSPDMLFGNRIDCWYQYFCKPRIRETTQASYENMIYNHIVPGIGNIRLDQLTQKDLQSFYNCEKKEGRQAHVEVLGDGLSNAMVRGIHALCRASLEKAKIDKLINLNPADGCRLPPKKAREMQVLTPEELHRFMIQASAEGYYELFLLELSSGMRRGELLALQWKDLDFETGELNIYKQVNRIKGKLVISPPKTKSSIRKIIIPAPVVDILKELHSKSTSIWLFPSPTKEVDEPLDPSTVKRRFSIILKRARCKPIRFHDLRHTFATMALQSGMDVKTLSSVIGHVSSATTLDIYAHITDEMQRGAAKKIEQGITKNPTIDIPTTPQQEKPMVFEPYKPTFGLYRRSGTGCISEINDHLYEGRYSPKWPDGKRHSRNVYAKTREECQEKLKKLIEEMDREIRLITIAGESADHRIPDGISQKKKAVMTYLSKHPEEKNKSLIARETGVDRSTVRKYYSEFIRLHETTK